MFKYLHNFLLLPVAIFFLGCTSTAPDMSPNREEELSKLLRSLNSAIPFIEAETLAHEIFKKTDKLRKKFKPVSEPHFNNFLINVGVKERGLCYQWSDALYIHFLNKNYQHFEFHLLVANKGKYFYEHNVFVIVSKSKNVMEGVIIDPWREPGKLYFSKVNEDKKYEWRHREKRCCQKGK